MKRIKQMRGWKIYELTTKEQADYGFTHAVIHPDTMPVGKYEPSDTDMECCSLEEAENWIRNY